VIGNFYASTLAHGIVVDVYIGAFVEAVVWRLVGRGSEVIVDVGEQCRERHFTWLRRHYRGWDKKHVSTREGGTTRALYTQQYTVGLRRV
jgi:hypothetical protein